MKILGTTIEPKWNWSAEYRAHVRRQMDWRVRGGERQSWVAIAEDQARKYARWLAARDGIELGDAIGAECEWHYEGGERYSVRAVAFRDPRLSYYPNGRSYHAGVATIEIPHFDFVPTVTGDTWGERGGRIVVEASYSCDARGRLVESVPAAPIEPRQLQLAA